MEMATCKSDVKQRAFVYAMSELVHRREFAITDSGGNKGEEQEEEEEGVWKRIAESCLPCLPLLCMCPLAVVGAAT